MANTPPYYESPAIAPSFEVAKNVVLLHYKKRLKEIRDMNILVRQHYITEERAVENLIEILEDFS